MAHGEKTDLGNLALHNRAAARLLNVRGVLLGASRPVQAETSGRSGKTRRGLPLLLIAVQVLIVGGCLLGVDRLVLDGKLSAALGDQLQIRSTQLQTLGQRLAIKAGFR